MEVLSTSWGGKAEHGILSVDARMDGRSLILTATDTEYNDYGPGAIQSHKEYIKEFETPVGVLHKDFLFRCIRDLLLENNATSYMFTEDDIRY